MACVEMTMIIDDKEFESELIFPELEMMESPGRTALNIFFMYDDESAKETWLAKRQSFSAKEREQRRIKSRASRAARKRNRH